MRTPALSRFAFTVTAAAALLPGCGGSQPPIGTPGTMPQSHALATHGRVLPGAKTEGLIYATGGGCGVCVLTYSDGTLKAKISVASAEGDCSDSDGNVFITNKAQILEYAHGGTTPIATLVLPGINANACAVDAGSGNLAVCGFGGNSGGNVAIYPNATSTPIVYDSGLGALYCGYDNSGNLFVSGLINGANSFSELPHGASAFIPITLNGNPGGPGQVQWDGNYITLENPGKNDVTIARLSVSGSTASVVSKTNLKGLKQAAQSWIAGNRVIVPYSTKGATTNKIGIWRYPTSGKIVTKFGDFGQSKLVGFAAVTLSKP